MPTTHTEHDVMPSPRLRVLLTSRRHFVMTAKGDKLTLVSLVYLSVPPPWTMSLHFQLNLSDDFMLP